LNSAIFSSLIWQFFEAGVDLMGKPFVLELNHIVQRQQKGKGEKS